MKLVRLAFAALIGAGILSGLVGRQGSAHADSPSTLDKIKAAKAITIGYRESSYPLSYVVKGGAPMGYHIDVCMKIADRVKQQLSLPDLKIDYLLVTSDNRLALVADGKVDLECGSTTNNAERQRKVAFAPTTFLARTRVAVRKNSGIAGLDQLSGKVVVTTKGADSIDMLRAKYPELKVTSVYADDHAQSFAMLEAGKADAFAMDDNLLAGLIANSADPGKYELVGEALDYQPIAIMFHKDDPAFKALVDDVVKGMMKSGEMDKLYDRWFNKPIPPKGATLNFPMTPMLKQLFLYPSSDTTESFLPPE